MIKYFTFLFVVAISFSCVAQKLEKIKGNRDVVDVYKTLDPFTSLEISSNLTVSLKQGETDGYHLEADSNLVDVLNFEVKDETLHIYCTSTIISSKRLNIDLDVTNLEQITLNDRSELNGLNKIETSTLTLTSLDDSEFKLDIRADDLVVTMVGNSKGDLHVKRGKMSVSLKDKSVLKGDMTVDECMLNVDERAEFDMDGDVEDLKITAVGSANIKASRLRAENVDIVASDESEIYLHATRMLTVYGQGKSALYVYGNPDMKVKGFKDSCRIMKK